jgi:glycosyltransferase involved in cell wall biosynthesis
MPKLLYISYWPYKDGLTQSTVIPNLKILAESGKWDKIIFTTLESTEQKSECVHSKINHQPFKNIDRTFKLLDRFLRWTQYKNYLKAVIRTENINCMVAKCSPSGIIASELSLLFNIPFYVESFEPHAEYMQESGVWDKWDPRFIKEKLGEKKVKKKASGLITVSGKYKDHLVEQNVNPNKIEVVPCVVDTELFRFNQNNRLLTRQDLQIPENAVVGINVGKYGGIYHDEKAFILFQFLFQQLPNYYQIFLTPDVDKVNERIATFHLPLNRCRVASVQNSQVPDYLSAADFGFVLVKSTPAKKFCSPIKTGEYWACGLPVIITEGIGDDSEIINETGTGVVWNALPESLTLVIDKLTTILTDPELKEKNRRLAMLYRNKERIEKAYRYFKLV